MIGVAQSVAQNDLKKNSDWLDTNSTTTPKTLCMLRPVDQSEFGAGFPFILITDLLRFPYNLPMERCYVYANNNHVVRSRSRR